MFVEYCFLVEKNNYLCQHCLCIHVLTSRSYLSLPDLWHSPRKTNGHDPRAPISSQALTEPPDPGIFPRSFCQVNMDKDRAHLYEPQYFFNHRVASCFWEATHQLVCLACLVGGGRGGACHSQACHHFLVQFFFVTSFFCTCVPALFLSTKWLANFFPA